ncbi:hypothetical protein KXW98_002298 [Aspergillus fumigatus]|uniref:Uncharacterized protein n=1 Tax=Aspergillus fumigatus TaxID=746128 RepID=A0A229YDK2_ASPFM|nr:hypothetical protein KXX45_005588 [Aspergillus fumigatus]KAH1298140.1 hypothetical protein KXX48_005014 [Aspergillus fumigatus]KAH1298605.1 hypothetical protein KXX30_006458 [Aspergillus fumigatus]KAH1308201.1 hypothetical protein KXX11_006848 [Aspergillus fumigatus]KAH1318143.1 hypothetical protein KXX47_002529 [Aspergillus fumigatus]
MAPVANFTFNFQPIHPVYVNPRFEKKCDAYMDELFDTWELALNVDDPYLDPAFC